MEGKTEEKPQSTSEKTVKEEPKEEIKPVNEQPVKETKCSLICGEVNYII